MINYSIGKYCIVRGNEFGVFAGSLVAVDNDGKTVHAYGGEVIRKLRETYGLLD